MLLQAKSKRRLIGVAVACSLLASRAAMAAEGMPQLNFETPLTVAQVVWGALIFFLLFWVLKSHALPQVAEVLEKRAATISSDLDAARRAKDEADGAVAELTEATRKAHNSAQAEIAGAVGAAKEQAAARSAELDARLNAQLADAEQRIAAAKASAIGALRDVATETTMALVTRLTGCAPDAARVDDAVGAALAARG